MSPVSKGQVLQLFVLRDGDLIASELFGEGIYLLGREPDCDVFLDHPNVATVQLELHEGKVHLSGSGGFHLNGQRVAEAELTSADDVWIGPFMLKTRLVRSRRSQGPGSAPPKTHRSGGAALSLVPQPPPPPAMEFEADEVEELLSSPLQARAPEAPGQEIAPITQPIALEPPQVGEAIPQAQPIAEPVAREPAAAATAPKAIGQAESAKPISLDEIESEDLLTPLSGESARDAAADVQEVDEVEEVEVEEIIDVAAVDASSAVTQVNYAKPASRPQRRRADDASRHRDIADITDPEARPLPYIDDVTDEAGDAAPVEVTRVEPSPLGSRVAASIAATPPAPAVEAPTAPQASIDELAAELAAELQVVKAKSAPGQAKTSSPGETKPEPRAGPPAAPPPAPVEAAALPPTARVRKPAAPASESAPPAAVASPQRSESLRPAPSAALPTPAQIHTNEPARPAARMTPPSAPPGALRPPPSAPPGSLRPTSSAGLRKPPSMPHEALRAESFLPERPERQPSPEPASTARPGSAARAPGRASPAAAGQAGLLHARIFWDDTLVFSCSSKPGGEKIFAEPAEAAALQLYGFAPASNVPLVRPAGAAFQVHVPLQTQIFQRATAGWTAASASASRELQLAMGNTVRLSRARFHLELSAQAAPAKTKTSFGADLDLRMLGLIATIGLALGLFIHFLPNDVTLPHPLNHEELRAVAMSIQERKPPPKKAKPKPLDAVKPAPPLIAQATTLKQASVQLRSLDKITKATKGISNLLASLTAAQKPSTKTDALAALPSVNRGPAPLPSLGGTGASGPVTKGSELLRGSNTNLLAAATGGHGDVAGVPVSVPKRPSKVQGSIDRDAVAKVINDKVSEMRACYERALLRDPNLGAGKVVLEWTIDATGAVGEVRTKTATLRSPEVVGCLLDLLRPLQFPKPNGGTAIVTYPVLFNSVGY